jgi:hypothetical protein
LDEERVWWEIEEGIEGRRDGGGEVTVRIFFFFEYVKLEDHKEIIISPFN